MIRFEVQALTREGYKGCSRGGRFWPSGAAVQVLVHNQDQDPLVDTSKDPKATIHTEDPRHIGQATFSLLKADPRLRIINAGDPMAVETEMVSNLRAGFDTRTEAAAKAHAAEIKDLKERHIEAIAELEKQLIEAKAKIPIIESHEIELEETPVAKGKGKKKDQLSV